MSNKINMHRLKTGVHGLDNLLRGGLPIGYSMFVVGPHPVPEKLY